MIFVQSLVHKFETISRSGYVKALVTLLAALLLAVIYDLRNFKNLSTQEAMDNAQLARNIAEGRGFTTSFVRPFSLYLLKRTGKTNEVSRMGVPDISNPPVYPYMLAGLMKLMKFDFNIIAPEGSTKAFWGSGLDFRRFQPDFLIAVFNQFLLLCLIALTFLWARKLFDSTVAWASVAMLLCTELLWKFSVSGLPKMLAMLIFMILIWCLTLFEEEIREPKRGRYGAMILAGAVGIVLGIGTLTQYSFAYLILTTLIFVIFCSGQRAVNFSLVVFVYLGVIVTPWVIRNYHWSGTAFGTATYSPIEGTVLFPDYQLQRSLEPNLHTVPRVLWIKLFGNLHAIREKLIGTGWVAPVFLIGLLIGFNNLTLRRIRYFVVISFATLILIEALGRTHLSVDSPAINSENLLILLLPIMAVYAVSVFWLLLERLQLDTIESWLFGIGFGAVASLPLILALIKGEPTLSYPPYHPMIIQQCASWMQKDELMASDIPWAVAWYGDRQCVWLTRDTVPAEDNPDDPENLLTVTQEFKPVKALFLTRLTLDAKLVSESVEQRENSWGKFALRALVMKDVPDNFPLHEMPNHFLPEHLFLSDAKRWQGDIVVPDLSAPIDPSLVPQKPEEGTQNPLQQRGLKPRGRR